MGSNPTRGSSWASSVVLCCLVFLSLSFSLSISWIIKSCNVHYVHIILVFIMMGLVSVNDYITTSLVGGAKILTKRLIPW